MPESRLDSGIALFQKHPYRGRLHRSDQLQTGGAGDGFEAGGGCIALPDPLIAGAVEGMKLHRPPGGKFHGIEGENAVGVYSANEFLTRVNLMQAYKFPETDTPIRVGKNVIVLGGGNSAMDAARCAMRLSPETVTIAYRRSAEEMPARAAEVEHAQEEGVQFEYLVTPKEVVKDEYGHVTGVRFTRNELGAPDEKGRRRPVEIAGSDFVMPADTVIVAIGQRPNPTITKTTPDLKTTERGVIALNEKGETSLKGVFAGGDIIRGGATVLLAMNDGIAAAGKINEYLGGK